jgi:hypothetical protein
VSVQHDAAVRFALSVWALLLDTVADALNDATGMQTVRSLLTSSGDW